MSKNRDILSRREHVAELLAQRLSIRQIVDELPKLDVLNPSDGSPWGHGTIQRDVAALETAWQESAKSSVDDFKAAQLAELDEVARAAWDDYRSNSRGTRALFLHVIMKAQERRAKLLGLDSPVKTESSHRFPDGPGYVAVMLPDNGRLPQEDRIPVSENGRNG